MSTRDKITKWLGSMTPGDGRVKREVVGVPLPPGTDLIMCSVCKSVIPRLAFYDHVRYHESLLYAEDPSEAKAPEPLA